MSQYLARLKCLARTCSFGKDEEGAALMPQAVLDESLRDNFAWEMKKYKGSTETFIRNKSHMLKLLN